MPGSRDEDFKEIMHFHYTAYMATPQHKNPCPRVMKFKKIGRPLLAHYYYILNLSALCLVEEKKIYRIGDQGQGRKNSR